MATYVRRIKLVAVYGDVSPCERKEREGKEGRDWMNFAEEEKSRREGLM